MAKKVKKLVIKKFKPTKIQIPKVKAPKQKMPKVTAGLKSAKSYARKWKI